MISITDYCTVSFWFEFKLFKVRGKAHGRPHKNLKCDVPISGRFLQIFYVIDMDHMYFFSKENVTLRQTILLAFRSTPRYLNFMK